MIVTSFLWQKTHSFYIQRIFWQSRSIKIFKLKRFLLFQALTLTCLGLHYNSMAEHGDQHTVMLINGTFVGFSIILVGLFAGYIMNTPINKRIGDYKLFITVKLTKLTCQTIPRSFLLNRWLHLVHHLGCLDLAILE